MSLTLIFRSDAHNSDQPPQSRRDDWTATVLDKLAQVGEIARLTGACGVLDGGDLFHIKSPSRNTHELVQRVATVHRGYPCPTWATVGNHDVRNASLGNLGENPLGVLFASGSLRPLYLPEHEAVFEQDGVKVRVVAVPYHGTAYDMNLFTTITKKDEDYLVVMAHVLATDKSMEGFPSEDVIQYKSLVNLDPDLWLFGHWHKYQGVKILGSKTFVNLGSMTRGSLSQDDLNREPAVAVLRFDAKGVHVEEIPLEVLPPEEVFDLQKKALTDESTAVMEDFVVNLQTTLNQTNTASLLDEVRAANAPEDIRERTIWYLEQAGAK